MLYSQYANTIDNSYGTRQINSYIRVLHASPNAPTVDIYANGNLIVQDLTYKELSLYLPVPSGDYNIMIYPSGQMTNPIINTNLYIPENTIFNVAVIGTLPDISLYPIPEPFTSHNSVNSCIRFIHLSPNAPAVDIKLPDGTIVFSNIGYKDITYYVCIPAGVYTFNFTPSGTNNVVLTVPNVNLNSNNFYTIYVVGLVGEAPGLEAMLVPEPRQ